MKKSKAISLLLTLTKSELKSFKKYLYDTYSSNKLAVKIFTYCYSKLEELEKQPKLFDLEIAYKKITKQSLTIGGKKVFQNALSTLYQNLVDFLLMNRIREDSFERDFILMDILNQRGQVQAVKQLMTQRKLKIADEKIANLWQPLQQMQLNHFAYFNHGEEAKIEDHTALFLDLMNNLDTAYTNFKLLYSCEMLNRMHIIPENYEIYLLSEVKEQLKPKVEENHPLASFYYSCLLLSQNRTEATCQVLQDYLKANQQSISKQNQLMAYILVANFMIQQIKQGQERYRKLLFDWYKEGFEAEIFTYKGTLDNLLFNNIVQNACQQKAFDWATSFVENYGLLLADAHRENLVQLCKANISFAQDDFPTTIDLLKDVEFSNVTYTLRANGLLLRAFYELKENRKFILDFCGSFKAFLKNDQYFGQATLDNYHTLIKYVRLFLRTRGRLSKEQLIQDLKSEKGQLFKGWIMDEIAVYKT